MGVELHVSLTSNVDSDALPDWNYCVSLGLAPHWAAECLGLYCICPLNYPRSDYQRFEGVTNLSHYDPVAANVHARPFHA
jgi:hypothetical protein